MKQIRPFANGSQYMDWEDANCNRCKKRATEEQIRKGEVPCQIEEALGLAMIGTGKISEDIWKRMGPDEGRYNWPCGEVEWTEEWKSEVLSRSKDAR